MSDLAAEIMEGQAGTAGSTQRDGGAPDRPGGSGGADGIGGFFATGGRPSDRTTSGGLGSGGGAGSGQGGSGSEQAGSGGTTGGGSTGGHNAGGQGGGNSGGNNSGGQGAGPGTDGDSGDPVGVPTFVAVGYGGIRMRSLDLGQTWVDVTSDGTGNNDDAFLLHGVAWAKGLFVAVGHRVLTSPDGAQWTERKRSDQWLGSVRFGNGRFVAAGGYGLSIASENCEAWQTGGLIGQPPEESRSLAFGDGIFVAASGQGTWWKSSNGETWVRHSDGHERNNETELAYCDGTFKVSKDCVSTEFSTRHKAYGKGVHIRVDWTQISRSEDGKSFKPVLATKFALDDVTFGYSPRPPAGL